MNFSMFHKSAPVRSGTARPEVPTSTRSYCGILLLFERTRQKRPVYAGVFIMEVGANANIVHDNRTRLQLQYIQYISDNIIYIIYIRHYSI